MVLKNRLPRLLRRLFPALLLGSVALTGTATQAEKIHVLKFATLAPAGTTWVRLLHDWADKVRKETNGRLIFKIYPVVYRVTSRRS